MTTQIEVRDSLARILDPLSACFTPEVAQKIADLQPDPAVQSRIGELAEKANEGFLTEGEAAAYDAYIHAMNVLAIIQAQARSILLTVT